MRTVVFIFVPVVIERTEIQIAVHSEQHDEQPLARNQAGRDELYPFWTWFIDNPRPRSTQ
jgi:hypothetical protein